MKAFTIAGVNLRRFFRDRSNVFWVFIFPILLILVLGAAFGGSSDPRLGVYQSGGESWALIWSPCWRRSRGCRSSNTGRGTA